MLSDTSDAAVAAVEEQRNSPRSPPHGGADSASPIAAATINTGFKAGNIRDFCERWGDAARIRRHARRRQLHDRRTRCCAWCASCRPIRKLGILQSLVVGLPSTSAFARIFQFGMRLGMRSYTIGSAWWQGDCGPYWGHNARLPHRAVHRSIASCRCLPATRVFGGHVLSHDQIEAVLMRRAGYDVRVLPDEDIGWEENPPTLIEFIRRDLRWCQGNMQYWYFLGTAGPEIRQPLSSSRSRC